MLAEFVLSCLAAVPVVSPIVAPRQSTFPIFATTTSQEELAACLADPLSTGTTGSDGDDAPVKPAAAAAKSGAADSSIHWASLANDSIRFLAIMHAFRWATEPGTRAGGFGLGNGYWRSAGNLHGWADGDPFYVNYVGHPMQGAVSGRLFLLNDPRYNRTEFGRSREYWKGKLRAAAFAWAFSEQFEIGLLSEASIGHIQADFPQQGFVDHVITPTIGLAWMLGEDAVDRYIVRPVEDRTTNRWLRMALRSALNPARSFANAVDGRAPWDRTSREGILAYRRDSASGAAAPVNPSMAPDSEPRPAPFEFTIASSARQFAGGPCIGGGADVAYRLAPELQVAFTVNGCKLLALEKDVSGDALLYQLGPRWTPAPTGKWSPYAHVLVGGMKITHEQLFPDKKLAVEAANANLDPMLAYTLHDQYTSHDESSGVALSAGTGVDYKLSEAFALRVASVEYLKSSVGTVRGLSYSTGLQVTTGMVLRLGTW